MSGASFSLLFTIAAYFLVGMLPVLWLLFTDRFRHAPSAQQYAVVFLVVGLLGLFLFLPAISIVAATGLLAVGLARLAARQSLRGVTYQRVFDPPHLFAGDSGILRLRLVNAKILPLAWINTTDPIHYPVLAGEVLNAMLRFSRDIELGSAGEEALVTRTALAPFQTLQRSYKFEALHRGVYAFGPVTIRSGDPFGFFPQEEEIFRREEVVVYPRLYQPEEIDIPFREAMGDIVKRRVLVEDPVLIAGARPYQPGDPLRRIHWKATARSGELQVRVADASTTAQIMLLLNLSTGRYVWDGLDTERLEVAISLTGTIAAWALDRDLAVGLYANGSEGSPRLRPSAGPQQLSLILEQLARVVFAGRRPIESMLLEEVRRLGPRGSIIVVTPHISPELAATLSAHNLTNRVSVVYCGRNAAPAIPGVKLHVARLWDHTLTG